jgi:hypothetical protein
VPTNTDWLTLLHRISIKWVSFEMLRAFHISFTLALGHTSPYKEVATFFFTEWHWNIATITIASVLSFFTAFQFHQFPPLFDESYQQFHLLHWICCFLSFWIFFRHMVPAIFIRFDSWICMPCILKLCRANIIGHSVSFSLNTWQNMPAS